MSAASLASRYPSVRLMRAAARARLPKPVFDFADGGAEDEVTLRLNEDAFRRWSLLPRPLEGAAIRDQSVELFGQRLSLPVIIGPTGLAGLFWPRGEIASAQAAAAASTAYCLSHGSVCSIEELAAQHRGLRWMQVFVYRDRGFTGELAQRARDAGYQALILTIDNQLLGKRERDLANGFSIPPRFSGRQWLAMAAKWRWAWAMRRELPTLTFGNYVRAGSTESLASLAGRMGSLLDPAMNWDDVAQLRSQWPGPLLLKGILHPDDARRATALGVDGLIVSNHGGRQLDGASSALEALPGIVAAVDARIPVLIDGGIRRGADVVKAVALGARAVLIARPQLWGLAVAGEAGVAHVLSIYRSEIDRVMGLAGASNLDALRRLDLLVACDDGMARRAVHVHAVHVQSARESANLKPKVFCIGCHKAGTTTLHAFALAHGYHSLHGVTWSKPDVPLLEAHDFFSDGGGHFWSDRCDEDDSYWGDFHNLTYLYSYYPDSRFILQTRPLKSWLVSKCLHAGWSDDTVIAPDDSTKILHDDWCYKSRLTVKEWIKARNRYHAKALAFFAKREKDKLCIVDVCTDTRNAAATLQAFLRLPGEVSLGHENAAAVRQSRALVSRIVSEILAELGESERRLI